MALSRSPIAAGLALVLTCGALAGCGSSSKSSTSANAADNGVAGKSPEEIVAATKAAADSATSVHVSGSIVTKEGTGLTLNLEIAGSRGGRGQLSEGGASFELIQVGQTVYIKGSPDFYRRIGGAAAAQLLQGRWLKAPTSNPDFASIGSITNLRKLLDSALESHGTLKKGPVQTVDGRQAVGVVDTSQGGTLYVATTGRPYPVAIAKTGKSGGKVSFSRWNLPVSITAPANAIDITQLRSAR
jgi:hypothetical protein